MFRIEFVWVGRLHLYIVYTISATPSSISRIFETSRASPRSQFKHIGGSYHEDMSDERVVIFTGPVVY